jgi:hypothetical protein
MQTIIDACLCGVFAIIYYVDMTLAHYLTLEKVKELSLPSNFRYGTAIYERGGVEFIGRDDAHAEGWVGGLDGTVVEGAGSRRRTTLSLDAGELTWHCSGNPKNHQIFRKHCVALALALSQAS